MRRHLNGTRITLACFCILTNIFAGQVQADSIPMNLTTCYDGVMPFSVSDMTVNGTVLLSYESDIEVAVLSTCKSEYFRINSSASELVLNSNLTKYCNPTIDCTIQCKQGANFRMTLLISITRNASYTLEFNQTSYNASIRELTPETEIHPPFRNQLKIRECNEGSLISSPSFYINQSTKPEWFTTKQATTAGIIYSTSLVDYEQLNGTTEVIMTILGEQTLDTGSTKLIAYTNLTVTIIDVDDMNPVFTEDVYHLNITEGKSGLSGNPYKTTPQIYAYDGDRGINATIKYSIEDSMMSNFSINSTNGEISIHHKLDVDEGRDIYVIIIKASQEDNPLRTATSTLSLSVNDIDDNPPIFLFDHYNCSINEHSAVGQVICTVKATDKDKGENANFTYQFRNTSNVIEIDQISGVIKVKDSQMLDREKEAIINVQVVTRYNDSDGPSTADVIINLIDINDNSPEFNSSSYEFRAWNKSVGDYIGKIDAFDLDEGDNKKLNYSTGICLSNTGNCSGDSSKCSFPFEIDPQFGNITLNESRASCVYSALVSVCDSPHYSTRCSTARLIIHVVSNVTNIVTQTTTVPENAANNSLVAQIPAECPGKSIVCDNSDKETVFRIDTQSNMVVTNGYLDYENTSSYNCSVVQPASDNTVMCMVIYNITVLDVNDNAPNFSKEHYFFVIPSNGSEFIGQVHAEDKDEDGKQAVTFDIQESSEIDLFRLNSTNGVLEARDVKALSRDYYHLSIMASDSAKPPLMSLVTVLLSRFAGKDNQLPLRTKFSKDEIESNKGNFERNIGEILKVDVTIEKHEIKSNEELQGNKIYISAKKNGSALSFEELLRLVIRHYDPLMSYLRGESQFTSGNNGDSGMTAPVITLIAIACVVFVGAFIAIIVIRKQYQGHQRYKRLYQNLTSHSSLYESQELKVRMEDETSDYNGSVNTQDLEISDQNKTGALTSTLNPMYGLDSAASTSVAEAMLSLSELSDHLNKEDNVPTPDYENVPSVSVDKNIPKPDYENVPSPLEDRDQTGMGELSSTEAPLTSSELDNVEMVRSESPTPDYDQHDASKEMVNTALEPNDVISEQDSETAEDSPNIDSEKNNENIQEEPLPDYNKKQVRFAHQVLDPDENKMTPLKHGDEKKDGDTKETSDATSEKKKDEHSSKHVVPPLDLSNEDNDEPKLNVSDESGWLEEEINSPIDVMTVDDKDNEFFEEEVTSL